MPNTAVALNTPATMPYDLQMLEAQRQQRLAEQLQQQLSTAIPIQQGGGAPAPIHWTSLLAKALQGYDAGNRERVAAGNIHQAGLQDSTTAQALAKQLMGTTATTAGTSDIAPQQTQISMASPQLPGQPPGQAGAPAMAQGTIPGIAGTGPQTTTTPPDPQQAIAAILAARGGPQTQMIQNAMLPNILNRQNLDYQHQLGRQDKLFENTLPMSTAAGQQIAAQGAQAQSNAQFQNNLPQTANERAVTGLGYAQLNKPQAVPFGAQMYDPRTRQMITPAGTGPAPTPIDPKSNSLLAQTGLSQSAFDYLTSGKLPRGQALAKAAQDEAGAFSRTHGVDTSTMQSQFKANNNTLQSNITRNNQAKVLEGEIGGTVNSIIPLANAIGQGQINAAGIANVWAGKEVNDPNVMKYRDQLLRLRSEIAGFNAVAAGKLTEHGQPRVDDGDLREAEQLISSGMNAGGAAGLAQSIQMTAHKNASVLNSAIDDANQSVWSQFGVGKNYKRSSPASGGDVGGAGGGNGGGVTFHYDKNGKRVPS